VGLDRISGKLRPAAAQTRGRRAVTTPAAGGAMPRSGGITAAVKSQGGLLFLAPAMALFALFVIYPIAYSIQASFLDWDGINPGHSVGFSNYVNILTDDPVFRTVLRNSAFWIFLTIFPQMFTGFGLALMLNTALRGRNIYRAIFYLPAIISPVVVGMIWRRIYDPSTGIAGSVADATGIHFFGIGLLGDPHWAIFACILVNIWQWTGFSMLLYLAGLQGLDQEVLDAAEVDGATVWQRIRYVIWPLLRGVHVTLILLGIIGSLKTFELIYVLTEGGPNHASEMLPTYTFREAFVNSHVGYAATISIMLLVISIGASMLFVRAFGTGSLGGEDRTV
jgi:multiple sugar transport system permease protein/raffinose/stachyose/melibiose transport system permease protein